MTREELKAMFPNASIACIAANTGGTAELEPRPRPEPLAAHQVQKPDSARFLVRVTAFRHRLLDEDNLCEKFHVDCCRYAGLIPSDAPQQTQIEVRQVQIGKYSSEFTQITITQQ